MDAIGQRLKEERLRKGWSQRDLARETGVNADTISGIETGQHEPRPSTLRRLTEGLGIEVRDLFAEPTLLGKAEAPETGQPDEEQPILDSHGVLDTLHNAVLAQEKRWKQALARSEEAPGIQQTARGGALEDVRRQLSEQFPDPAMFGEMVFGALTHSVYRYIYLEEEAARLREELAVLRDRLQEREQTHS